MTFAQRGRGTAVLAFLVAGGVGILSSTQTWLTVTRADAGEDILVPGADALPLLAPLSLAVLALGAALSIVGLVLRYVFAVLALGGAVLLGGSTIGLLVDPALSAVAATVTETTGLAGPAAVAEAVAALTPSGWPVLALGAWAVLLAGALFVLVTARRWRRSGRRFRTDGTAAGTADGPVDAVDSWDDLSRGSDPTR